MIINDEEKFKKIDNILFIKETPNSLLMQSLFSSAYNKLPESEKEKLDEKYNCILCSTMIKKENPYLCYKCQKIFHEKCLKEWNNKCKLQNKILECPNCRNELSIEKWNKKLDYEDNRIENANILNKIKEYEKMKNNINIIKDKKIIKYENYINKTIIIIFKKILIKINSIVNNMKIKNNNKLNELIENSNLNIYNINDISSIIYEELDKINKNIFINKINNEIKNKDKINIVNKKNNALNEYKNEINLIYDADDESNINNINFQSNSNIQNQINYKNQNNFMMKLQKYEQNNDDAQSQSSIKAVKNFSIREFTKNKIKLYLKEVQSKLDYKSFREFIRNIKLLTMSNKEPNIDKEIIIEKIRILLLEKDSELFEKFIQILYNDL